jgi:hypothetical protein
VRSVWLVSTVFLTDLQRIYNGSNVFDQLITTVEPSQRKNLTAPIAPDGTLLPRTNLVWELSTIT